MPLAFGWGAFHTHGSPVASVRPVEGLGVCPAQVKSRFISPNDTQATYTEQSATLMCLFGQPALKVRLAASKRDGNEWTWAVNIAPTAAAVWDERTCEVAGDKSSQNSRALL